jgi:hypothetical protein
VLLLGKLVPQVLPINQQKQHPGLGCGNGGALWCSSGRVGGWVGSAAAHAPLPLAQQARGVCLLLPMLLLLLQLHMDMVCVGLCGRAQRTTHPRQGTPTTTPAAAAAAGAVLGCRGLSLPRTALPAAGEGGAAQQPPLGQQLSTAQCSAAPCFEISNIHPWRTPPGQLVCCLMLAGWPPLLVG